MNDAYQAQQELMQAIQNYQKGDLKKAAETLEKLSGTFGHSDQVHSLLGTVYFGLKKYKDAIRSFKEATKINPNNKEALIGIGSAEKSRGRFENAETSFKKALKLFPNAAELHFNIGDLQVAMGNHKLAIQSFGKAYELNKELYPALMQLSSLHYELKEYEKTEYYLEVLLERDPENHQLLAKLNEVRSLQGKTVLEDPKIVVGKSDVTEVRNHEDAAQWFESFGIAPDNIEDLISLAHLFTEQSKHSEAEKVYQHILSIDPNNQKAKHSLEGMLALKIPRWHFDMLADSKRNDAFEKAIVKCIDKKSRVLDIGTGSGLLSMMSARAGAESILACEVNPEIAKVATRIVQANGYTDRVSVINKRSDHLEPGEDYTGKFNVIVSEILDSGGLGEGVLPSLRQAKSEMGTSDVKIIPAGIALKAQLIEIPKLHEVNPIKTISGFDLSIFDEFRVSDTYTPVNLANQDYKGLSEIFDLRSYDFYNIHEYEIDFDNPEIDQLEIAVSDNGMVQAVAFWFDLHMDEEDTYSSGPGGELDHWLQAIYYFEQPKRVEQGDRVSLKALYSDWMVRFRLS
ncbi:hypothetical protein BFP97_14615 [Roseivirga sp. 4D4]|uniref:tetratricopeptide repeat protein n=1 Tax=Roseivirga sp. 4D4 TaxID=1889784 RepID=UPI000852FA1E|nr:tetratricopeptide repeat protein [Roseivirga sp. 4D4]OEK02680.1 hypothetical protein BFP97_14615 [Roseivirga sp. 4D4]